MGIKWVYLLTSRDLCKTPPFAQIALKVSAFASLRVTSCRRQAQILSLEILNVFLHLKFSSSLNLNKIEHFSKVSSIAKKKSGDRRQD